MSPDVWRDAKALIDAAAEDLGIPVEWPNELLSRDNGVAPFLSVEVAAESAESMELGNAVWDERGTIWLHLMIPMGTGIDYALAQRKALSVAFRMAQPVEGLFYRSHAFDPLGAEDGVYRRLSLLVRYEWTDIVNPHAVYAGALLAGVGDSGD